MSPPPSTEVSVTFTCECDEEWLRSACEGLPFYKEHESKRYCVLHYPGGDKVAAFNEAFRRKLDVEDFDFGGVWFPGEVNFDNYKFTRSADFSLATFSADVNFERAAFNAGVDFISATFRGEAAFNYTAFKAKADFSYATFNAEASFFQAAFDAQADFVYAAFNAEADFSSSTFDAAAAFICATFSAKARFPGATFHAEATFFEAAFNAEADFAFTTFNAKADFDSAAFNTETFFRFATFKDYVAFTGTEAKKVFGAHSSLNLQFATIEKPDRFSFHTLSLRPHWFVNVDARKFVFTNVGWDWRGIGVKQEIKSLNNDSFNKAIDVLSKHRLLAIACRNLAVNAEENHRYEEASQFRYMAMEARRLERWRGLVPWRLGWWYWLASGYGERVWRAFAVLIVMWLLAAALYTQVGFVRWEPRVSSEQEAWEARRDEVGQPLRWQRALTYSLGVMTLQKPEPRPATDAAQALVMLETVLGPVQAALLALAIRRKFMR